MIVQLLTQEYVIQSHVHVVLFGMVVPVLTRHWPLPAICQITT